jgi:hypothetical protein
MLAAATHQRSPRPPVISRHSLIPVAGSDDRFGWKADHRVSVVSARNVTFDDSSADQSAPDFCTSQVIARIGFGGWCEYLD